MKKGLFLKVALGLIVLSIPASIIINKQKPIESIEATPEVNTQDDTVKEDDVIDDLYNDTFEDDVNTEDKETEKPVEYPGEDLFEDIDEQEASKKEENKKEDSITVTATFQGFADSNFAEMKIGNDYSVFKVPNNLKSKIESRNIGDSITFTYIKSAGQQLITSVN